MDLYETHNLNLAAYIMTRGVEYKGCRRVNDDIGKKKILFQFVDPDLRCTQVAQEFLTSETKKAFDCWYFLRDQIAKNMERSYGSSFKSDRTC